MFNELTKGEIMKKIYNQPEIEVQELQAMSVICGSFTPGGDAPGDSLGD